MLRRKTKQNLFWFQNQGQSRNNFPSPGAYLQINIACTYVVRFLWCESLCVASISYYRTRRSALCALLLFVDPFRHHREPAPTDSFPQSPAGPNPGWLAPFLIKHNTPSALSDKSDLTLDVSSARDVCVRVCLRERYRPPEPMNTPRNLRHDSFQLSFILRDEFWYFWNIASSC